MMKLKSELSEKNKYWIPKHRYYELRHFCLQYNDWRTAYNTITYISAVDLSPLLARSDLNDPVARAAEARIFYKGRIDLVERIAKETDPLLSAYILKGVTEELSYDVIRARMDIPCCREVYYEAYRRFFWLLDKARN